MKFFKMYCAHCKGVMVANGEKDILNCPYCGALFVTQQAVKDYESNVGNSLDGQLHFAVGTNNQIIESGRKVECKVIEKAPEGEIVQNDDMSRKAIIIEPKNSVEIDNQEIETANSFENDFVENAVPDVENYAGNIDDEQYQTVNVDETAENAEQNINVEMENLTEEVDSVQESHQEDLTANFSQEQQSVGGEIEQQEVSEQSSVEDFNQSHSLEQQEVFVDPFENKDDYKEQLKTLFYQGNPNGEYEPMKEEVVQSVIDTEPIIPVAVRPQKPEFEIKDGVLEAYNGTGEIIVIPEEVTKINASAFFSCKNLKEVNIGSNVQYIGDGSFVHCVNIEKYVIAKENQSYCSNGNCIVDKRQKMLIYGCKNTVIPVDGSVLRIGAGAFSDCIGLQSFYIPEGIISIGNSAFKGCINLKKVNIPASASYIAHNAFERTTLEDVSVSGGGLKKCLRCGTDMMYGTNSCSCGCIYTIK